MLIGSSVMLGLTMATCFDTVNYHDKTFKLWDTWRKYGFELEYYATETYDYNGNNQGEYYRYQLKVTYDQNNALEVQIGTDNYMELANDTNFFLMAYGDGDFVKFVNNYKSNLLYRDEAYDDDIFMDSVGRIYR